MSNRLKYTVLNPKAPHSKRCPDCGLTKATKLNFHLLPTGYPRTYCKPCTTTRVREWSQKNRARLNKRQKERRRRLRQHQELMVVTNGAVTKENPMPKTKPTDVGIDIKLVDNKPVGTLKLPLNPTAQELFDALDGALETLENLPEDMPFSVTRARSS